MEDLQPQSGVRVLLRLASQPSDEGAAYDVTLYLVDGEMTGRAQVPPKGAVDLTWEGEPPAYAITAAGAFLRQTQGSFRSTEKWPRRVLRWRAEK